MIASALVFVAAAAVPTPAHAWSPGTHIFLGESVLANLGQLPPWIAELLRAFPYDFLYGNIAADTSIAKKYAPVGRHCHSWQVGQEIFDLAESEPLRAFGLGYLSHLAADAVAHNFFVPRQLVVAAGATGLGHSYWESRFETHLGDQYARTAMDVIRLDHAGAERHLDEILSPTIFSVRTSRRLFQGMVGITETRSWQRAFRVVSTNSRYDLTDAEVDRNMGVAFHLVMDMLGSNDAKARQLDPSGEASLKLAKRLRGEAARIRLQTTDGEQLETVADEHFALPDYELTFWESSDAQRPWRRGPEGSSD